jgi:hypothetical protein
MPYVERDSDGRISGLYAQLQSGFAEEFLDEGHPDLVIFLAPLEPEPLAQPLDRLRFWLAAASAHISKWDIRDRIAAMPDSTFEEKQEKGEAIAWFEEAKQYRRDDPLLIRFAAEEGISEQELDALWIWTVQSAAPSPQQSG